MHSQRGVSEVCSITNDVGMPSTSVTNNAATSSLAAWLDRLAMACTSMPTYAAVKQAVTEKVYGTRHVWTAFRLLEQHCK